MRIYLRKKWRSIYEYCRLNFELRRRIESLPRALFFPIIFTYGAITFCLTVEFQRIWRNVQIISKKYHYSPITRCIIFFKTLMYVYIGAVEIYAFHLRKNSSVSRQLERHFHISGLHYINEAIKTHGAVILAPLHLVNNALWSVVLSNLNLPNTLVTMSGIEALIKSEKKFCANYMGRSEVDVYSVDKNRGQNIFGLVKALKTDTIINMAPDNNGGGQSKISPTLFGADFSGGIGVVLLSKLNKIPIVTASISRRHPLKLFQFDAVIHPPRFYGEKKGTLSESLAQDIPDYFSHIESIILPQLPEWTILNSVDLKLIQS